MSSPQRPSSPLAERLSTATNSSSPARPSEPSSDVAELLSYMAASAEAHPDLDARGLLAQASYVYAVDGWDRVRRSAHVELFPSQSVWPGSCEPVTRVCVLDQHPRCTGPCGCYCHRPEPAPNDQEAVPESAKHACGNERPHDAHDWIEQTGEIDYDPYWCVGRVPANDQEDR